MRNRLMRGITASLLALAVLLPGAAQPARAGDKPGISDEVVEAVQTGFRIFGSANPTPDDFVLFIRQITAAIAGVNSAVDGHVDGLEAATVLANARTTGRQMLDYDVVRQNEIHLWMFAMDVTGYADNAYEKYRAVDSKTAKDQIGLAAQGIYTTALVAREDAGAGGLAELEADYKDLNKRILAELEPVCTWRPGELDDHPLYIDRYYECKAANGNKATARDYAVGDKWTHGPVNIEALKLEAAMNSAWAVAKDLEGMGP